jgi:DNA-directed RNA polymerase II subunit RPB9
MINPSVSKESLLIKKDYQAAKAVDITDSSLVLDPSMPRKRVTCRK